MFFSRGESGILRKVPGEPRGRWVGLRPAANEAFPGRGTSLSLRCTNSALMGKGQERQTFSAVKGRIHAMSLCLFYHMISNLFERVRHILVLHVPYLNI